MNVTAPLRRLARIAPSAIAIIGPDGAQLSFQALDARIDTLARRALAHGMRPGQLATLTIAGPHDLPHLLLALALARIGVGTADHTLPGHLVHWRFARPGAEFAGDILAVPAWLTDPPATAPVAIDANDDAIFSVFTSSGTTGAARHIPVTHRQMTARVLSRALCDGAAPVRRMVLTAPGGAWGMSIILRTLWYGGTVVMSEQADILAGIARHAVAAINASPQTLRTLLDLRPADGRPLPDLAVIETGGSRLPPALAADIAARLCPTISVSLASSEAGAFASAPLDVIAEIDGAVGLVWPGVTIEAVGPDHRPLPPGEVGNLRLRGEMVANGYLGDDVATADSFIDGWFYSGDIGALTPDGLLILTGRRTELINFGGDKVAPWRIEQSLLRLPSVSDAAAFGIEDSDGIERIWAAIVAPVPIDEDEINRFCARELGHLAPSTLLQFRELPRNEAGKIRRDLLIAYARDLNDTMPEAD